MPTEGTLALAPGAAAPTCATTRRTVRQLEEWLRSYRPEELFDEDGRLVPELAALAPHGERRMSANPHANGGALLRDLVLPDFRDYAVEVDAPGDDARARRRACSAASCATSIAANPDNVPALRPRRDGLQPAGDVFEVTDRAWQAETLPDRRAPRPGRARDGGAVGAPLPGLARGLPADRPARPLQLLRGVHPHRRLDVQPAREVAEDDARDPLAAADRVAQLPALLARLAAGPQRLLATRTPASSTTS